MKHWNFPVYRKYSNNKVYFKIISLTEFEEINISGTKVRKISVIATIHPDRVRIMDMLENTGGYWEEASEKEWESYER